MLWCRQELPYNDFLEAAQVPVEVLAEVAQIQNGVGHQLAWAMVCDLSAPLCAEQWEWRVAGAEA